MLLMGGLEVLVLVMLLLWAVSMGVTLWGVVDAATRPDHDWHAAGQNKVLWITLQAVGFWVFFAGLVLSIVYLTTIRPKLRAAQGF